MTTIAQKVADTIANAPPRKFTEMLPQVYHELRNVGRSLLRGERAGHTLQPTAVINEAYLRLAGVNPDVQDKAHCFRLLAQTMRRVLIDHGKNKRRLKRETPTPDEVELLTTAPFLPGNTPIDTQDVAIALEELSAKSAQAAEMVQLRYFFGLEDQEISALLNVSVTTVERTCRMSKAWLSQRLAPQPEPESEYDYSPSPGM